MTKEQSTAEMRYRLGKKSMVEIYMDFERSIKEDTNVQISISSSDKTARQLAKAINLQLSELRKIKLQYEDEYKKALQLIKLAAQNQQTEEFEHRKAG